MKRRDDLESVCLRVGCKEDMNCFGTIDWCKQARQVATIEEWNKWEEYFIEEIG